MRKKLVLLALSILCARSAVAQNFLEKSIGSWNVFSYHKENKTYCYMVLTNDKLKQANSGESYVIVSAVETEPSIIVSSGNMYKNDQDVILRLYSKMNEETVFQLTPKEQLAWAPSDNSNKEIIQILPKTYRIVLKAFSFNGESIFDEYELRETKEAMSFLLKGCPAVSQERLDSSIRNAKRLAEEKAYLNKGSAEQPSSLSLKEGEQKSATKAAIKKTKKTKGKKRKHVKQKANGPKKP